ncbi:hypothetical protein Pelo_1164 [Pelomyxa schiedti]|nr:hypothetical protein Pelo_1164 [Pelomyxa schiedti]
MMSGVPPVGQPSRFVLGFPSWWGNRTPRCIIVWALLIVFVSSSILLDVVGSSPSPARGPTVPSSQLAPHRFPQPLRHLHPGTFTTTTTTTTTTPELVPASSAVVSVDDGKSDSDSDDEGVLEWSRVIMFCCGSMSIVCCLFIMTTCVAFGKHRLVYFRMVVGLAVSDFISSVSFILAATWVRESDTTACTVQAILLQTADITGICYYFVIALYLCIIAGNHFFPQNCIQFDRT